MYHVNQNNNSAQNTMVNTGSLMSVSKMLLVITCDECWPLFHWAFQKNNALKLANQNLGYKHKPY